ncbi:hypothetical protein pb186bvf_003421 [Paramecium bursaria]
MNTRQNQFQGPLIDPLQQFAQQFGQQQYQPPMMPGQMPNFQQPPVQQLMGDYEQLRQDVNYMQQQPTQRRPQSRELDLLNLLLIGSMDKSKSRSGLEGMSQLFSPQGQQQQQFPQFGMPMPVHPQQQHFANFQQPQGQPFQLPQMQQLQQMPQMPQQSPYDFASPPSQQIRNTGQLIVNGQMGVQVDQQQQNPYVEQRSNRLLEYVERQNQILAQLTQNIGRKKDEQQAQEKKQLQERLKALEQLNSKDAEINDMYDDMPQHRRPVQHMRPIAPYIPYQPQYPYPPPPPNYYQPQQNIPYY